MSPDPIPGWTPLDLAQATLVALDAARLHLAVLAAVCAVGLALARWPIPAAAVALVGAGLATNLGPALRGARLAEAPAVSGPAATPAVSPVAAASAAASAAVAAGGSAGEPPVDITLISANIRRRNPRMGEALAALAALDPDVTVLIEAEARAPGPLADALASPGAAPLGHATLARYEWISLLVLSKGAAAPGPPIRFLKRMPARTVVDVEVAPGRMLRVVGVHFSSPFLQSHLNQRQGRAQFGQVATDPLVAVGDFNAPVWGGELPEIAGPLGARLVGGWRPSWFPGEGAASRALRPWLGLAIDHMLVTPSVEVLSIRMAPIPGSDHLAQVARLRLRWPGAAGG